MHVHENLEPSGHAEAKLLLAYEDTENDPLVFVLDGASAKQPAKKKRRGKKTNSITANSFGAHLSIANFRGSNNEMMCLAWRVKLASTQEGLSVTPVRPVAILTGNLDVDTVLWKVL